MLVGLLVTVLPVSFVSLVWCKRRSIFIGLGSGQNSELRTFPSDSTANTHKLYSIYLLYLLYLSVDSLKSHDRVMKVPNDY